MSTTRFCKKCDRNTLHDKELAVMAERVAMVWVEIAKINETRQ